MYQKIKISKGNKKKLENLMLKKQFTLSNYLVNSFIVNQKDNNRSTF